MPLRSRLLLGAQPVNGFFLVVLFPLDGADDANLGVVAAELPARVEQRVDVQARLGRAAGEPTEAFNQLLLQVIGQVILRTEDNNTALRNWKKELVRPRSYKCMMVGVRGVLTCHCQVPNELIRVGRSEKLNEIRFGIFSTDAGANLD